TRLPSTVTPPPSGSPLSLHDALPILVCADGAPVERLGTHDFDEPARRVRSLHTGDSGDTAGRGSGGCRHANRRELSLNPCICERDRKSTRLNSSHVSSSYAVFCLKKK